MCLLSVEPSYTTGETLKRLTFMQIFIYALACCQGNALIFHKTLLCFCGNIWYMILSWTVLDGCHRSVLMVAAVHITEVN